MINKFPNKLRDLRKSLGYAQGEMASRLDISVKDYMNWENGNSLPAFSQIQKMAILFNTPVELLMDNRKEISQDLLDTLSKSVIIPSFVQAKKEVSQTATMDLASKVQSVDAFEETKVMSTIQDNQHKKEIKEEVEKRKKISRKAIWIGSGVTASVILLAVLISLFFNRKNT